MPLCPDCYAEGRLEVMINFHDETVKGKLYAILECISCGSSIRLPKRIQADGKETTP